MNKIALIQPYFGKFPDYFPLHLLTILKNPTIKWIFFTDDKTDYDWPDNCEVHYMEFDEIQKYIASKFDFKISLKTPYKLCDYKPAYGYIFSEYLKGYDFWGHCDVDILWGNIRKYLTEDVLNNHDFLFRTGHFRLYRNIDRMNRFFMSSKLQFGYKTIYTHDENYAFDEMNSMQRELLHAGFRYYNNDNIEADTDPFQSGIKLREVSQNRRKYQVYRTVQNYEDQIFVWQDGYLLRYYIKDGNVHHDEFVDIHFLKRKMNIVGSLDSISNKIIISPVTFYLNKVEEITKETIKNLSCEQLNKQEKAIFESKLKRFLKIDKKRQIIQFRKKWFNILIKLNLK